MNIDLENQSHEHEINTDIERVMVLASVYAPAPTQDTFKNKFIKCLLIFIWVSLALLLVIVCDLLSAEYHLNKALILSDGSN